MSTVSLFAELSCCSLSLSLYGWYDLYKQFFYDILICGFKNRKLLYFLRKKRPFSCTRGFKCYVKRFENFRFLKVIALFLSTHLTWETEFVTWTFIFSRYMGWKKKNSYYLEKTKVLKPLHVALETSGTWKRALFSEEV